MPPTNARTETLGAFAADVVGVDLAQFADSPDPDTLTWLKEQLAQHLVLRFRDQHLTPTQVVAFASGFGVVDEGLRRERDRASHLAPTSAGSPKPASRGAHFAEAPGVKVISARAGYDGAPVGDRPRAELDWHADGTFRTNPCAWSLLYCRVAPAVDPPQTYWVDLQRAFAALSPERQGELSRLRILHKSEAYPTKFLPEGSPMVGDCRSIAHPVARLIPETGQPAIFLPNDRDCPVVENGERWSDADSLRFIEGLYDFAAANSPTFDTALVPDDLVLWDNRATVHRRDDIDPDIERELWLTTILGEAPVAWVPQLVSTPAP